ncbi:MAG: InlB B-repeat-containing protein [Clostridia bacterium]|nr:InlB B-repeat-containing protein [Clostridia bacterium]
MTKTCKRLLSVLLAALMLFALMPVTAFAIPAEYTVTYVANGGLGEVPVDPDSPHEEGELVTVMANTLTWDGHTFAGWSDGTTVYQAGGTFNIEQDTVLTAQWTHENMISHAEVGATCTANGNIAYWYCQDCNKYFSDANGQNEIQPNDWVIPALGHNYEGVSYSSDDTQHWKVCSRCHEDSAHLNHTWGDATYSWSADNSQVTAAHTCTACGKEVTETVIPTTSVTQATCTTGELTTYTANFYKDGFVQQVKSNVETTPALGHNYENVAYSSDDTQHWKVCSRCHEDSEHLNHTWGDATYSWSADNSQVTASHTCTACGKEVSETVNPSSSVTPASCLLPELTTYTATFYKDGFVQQVKSGVVTAPASGHNYEGVAYSYDETQHWKVCSSCHEDSAHENHTWGDATYNWKDDNSEVTASHTCTVCGKEVSETVTPATSVTAATCTTAELTTYTATFYKDGFVQQVKSNVVTSPALGHDFQYSALDTVIIATCSHNGCAYHTNGASITLRAPALTTYGGTESASAALEGVADFNSATGLSVSANNIAYYNTKLEGTQLVKDGAALTAAPTDAGTYWAEIAVEGATASVTYTISPMALTITGATATNRAYDKDSTAVTISAVTFKDNNNQPVALTLGENGDYTVTGAMADANAGDNKEVTVTVTLKNGNYSLATNTTVTTVNISKAAPGYTVPTDVEATYGDTISSVTLPDGWTWEDDPTTSVGNVGSWQFPATFTPGDTANYEIVEHVQVTVTVNKAASAAATVAANEWTFDGATKPLVTVTGAPVGGDMVYALGDATAATGAFGDAIPEASDPDTYYVWYKVVGDGNHNDTDAVCVTVVVAHDEELDAVIAAINAIGPVTEVLADQKAKIDAAREGYEALTAAQKLLVTNYATLVDAEADYKALFVYGANTQVTVSGTERIGETLTATATDIPAFITDSVIRWYNDNGDLLGTGATYVIPESQIGRAIRAELYSAEAADAVHSDFTGAVDKGIIKGYKLPTAAAIMYPQKLSEATLTGGDTGAVEGVWAWVLADEQPTSAQNGSLYELTFTPTGAYAALYEVINAKLAITVNPAPFEPKTVEDPVTGLVLEADFAQNVEIELTDIAYSQSAYLALLRASKKDDSGMTRLVLLKTIVFTIGGEAADEAYNGAVTVTSYVGAKLAGQTVSVWFFIDGEPVNYVGTVGYDGVLVIENVAL